MANQIEGNATRTWQIKAGDRLTPIAAQLLDADGEPVDLSAATVAFRLVKADGTVTVNSASATIDDAEQGHVSYTLPALSAGTYYAEWIVSEGGLVDTYPPDGKRFRLLVGAGAG